MSQTTLSGAAASLIDTYGQSAHNLVNAWRVAGTRVVGFIDQRWDSAIARSAPSLDTGVRENATAAQRKLAGIYSKGLELSTAGADLFIGKFVELADKGVQQAAANAERFEQATGVQALSQLAAASVPAVLVVSKAVDVLEQKTAALAQRVAAQKPAARRTRKAA